VARCKWDTNERKTIFAIEVKRTPDGVAGKDREIAYVGMEQEA
jgi:hypothetical protein